MHMCACSYLRSRVVCSLGHSPLFFEAGSLWTWSPSVRLSWLDHTEATGVHTMSGVLMWVLGIELGSPYMHGRRTTYLAVSPVTPRSSSVPYLFFFMGTYRTDRLVLTVFISETNWVFFLYHQSWYLVSDAWLPSWPFPAFCFPLNNVSVLFTWFRSSLSIHFEKRWE